MSAVLPRYGSVETAGAGRRRAGSGSGAACALAVFSLAVVILAVVPSRGTAVAELVEQTGGADQPAAGGAEMDGGAGKLWWGRKHDRKNKNKHAGKVWVQGSRSGKGFWKWIDPREIDENGERLGDRVMVWKKGMGKKHGRGHRSKGHWATASSMDAEERSVGSYHDFQPLYAPNKEDASLSEGGSSPPL